MKEKIPESILRASWRFFYLWPIHFSIIRGLPGSEKWKRDRSAPGHFIWTLGFDGRRDLSAGRGAGGAWSMILAQKVFSIIKFILLFCNDDLWWHPPFVSPLGVLLPLSQRGFKFCRKANVVSPSGSRAQKKIQASRAQFSAEGKSQPWQFSVCPSVQKGWDVAVVKYERGREVRKERGSSVLQQLSENHPGAKPRTVSIIHNLIAAF